MCISQKEIALQVGVSESTISNEKKRNIKSDDLYDADVANNLAAKGRNDIFRSYGTLKTRKTILLL